MPHAHEAMTTKEALELFDSLDSVPTDMMIGPWQGIGIETGHPLDGMLEACRWHGKIFEGPDRVYPLVHCSPFGGKICLNPGLLPIGLIEALPFRDLLLRLVFPILAPLLSTRRPTARLRMTEYRGKVSATMQYDAKPINDIFRKIDSNTVLGLMDRKYDKRPYFFKLMREAR